MKGRIFPLLAVTLLLGFAFGAAASCGGGASSRQTPSATDDDASPADDDVSPVDDDVSPVDDDASPVDDDQSPAADDDDNDDMFNCDVIHPHSTVGLISCLPGAYTGYTLFAPLMADTVYLIDMSGRVVNTWAGQYLPGLSVYLLDNGQLLRTGNALNLNFPSGPQGGVVTLQNWDGTTAWNYLMCSDEVCAHHDVHMMPNGHILMIMWERKTTAEVVAAGRDPNTYPYKEMFADYIAEIAPVGTDDVQVVWEWHTWDHLIQDYDPTQANFGLVGAHPELIDINYGVPRQSDWQHTNGIDYNADFDQILVSVRNFSEVWVIDHSTTADEAATHDGGRYGRGGDLLYRWGNPAAYRQTSPPQDFYNQHDGQWIADGLPGAGHMLVYNNGDDRPAGQYSSVDEFVPAVNPDGSYAAADPAYGPAGLTWTFVDAVPTDMYSNFYSSAQRLANGNTFICNGETGVFMEVTAAGAVLWQFVNPVTGSGVMQQGQQIPANGTAGNGAFRAYRYAPDYPGFAGKNLAPGGCLAPPC